jgi:hypothetical protein
MVSDSEHQRGWPSDSSRSTFIAWSVSSAVWAWFLYGFGSFLATGIFQEPTQEQRRTGVVLATIALLGPGVVGLAVARRFRRPGWQMVSAVLLAAAALAGASVYWWDDWVWF